MKIIDDRNYLDFVNKQRDAGWPAGAIPREKDGLSVDAFMNK